MCGLRLALCLSSRLGGCMGMSLRLAGRMLGTASMRLRLFGCASRTARVRLRFTRRTLRDLCLSASFARSLTGRPGVAVGLSGRLTRRL